MTLLELFGLFSILTPLTVVIFKLYWDSVKDESSRLRKANEVLSRTLNNYILKGIIPSAKEFTVFKQEIARKYKVNVTRLDDISTGICNVYTSFISKHIETKQFEYNFKTYSRKFEEDWIEIKFSWNELLKDSYITAVILFGVLLINGLYLGIEVDEEYYYMLLVFTGILSTVSQLVLQPIFNHINEKERKKKADNAREIVEFWGK